jgi:hypothetical protein
VLRFFWCAVLCHAVVVLQVKYTDGVPGDLSTAHPTILSDGSLLNFTRSLPNGGFHVYKQDTTTLKRTEVRGVAGAGCVASMYLHNIVSFGGCEGSLADIVLGFHPVYARWCLGVWVCFLWLSCAFASTSCSRAQHSRAKQAHQLPSLVTHTPQYRVAAAAAAAAAARLGSSLTGTP